MTGGGAVPIPVPHVPGDAVDVLRAVLPVARQETDEGDDALWVVADLLEPLDPTTMRPDLVVADAALLLFGEVGFGPTSKALLWLRYAQRVTVDVLGLSDSLTCRANTAAGRLFDRLGRYHEAAPAWAAAAAGHAASGQWHQAHDARIKQAKCLYGIGHCADAVTLVTQAWQRCKAEADVSVVAASTLLLCAEMLRLCGRRDEARVMWSELVDRYRNDRLFAEWVKANMDYCEGPVNAGTHWRVCAFWTRGTTSGGHTPDGRSAPISAATSTPTT